MAFKIGVVRDQRYLEHKPGLMHPESPNRLKNVYRMVDREFSDSTISIEPRLATLEELELVHDSEYVNQILNLAEREFTTLASDTSMSAKSYLSAWLAVGGCIEGLDWVMNDKCKACFCLVRPPGHHALSDRAGGFCIFNNLGVTAMKALLKYDLQRILVVDWDVHHGNAIQDLFYKDKRVLYFSTHYLGWYPHTGHWEETGEGEGLGYSVNIPIPKELADNDMIHLYRGVLSPIVRRFKPELIIVAAGFDAHKRDPLGRTRLTEVAYGWLTQLILQLSDSARGAPVLMGLEGGYDTWALTASVREVLKMFTFEGRRDKLPNVKTQIAEELIEKAKSIHSKYGVWK